MLRRATLPLIAALIVPMSAKALPVELITNGGFEDGPVGFTSDFTDRSPISPGLASFSVGVSSFLGLGPNSGASFMAVNGGNDLSLDPVVWSQDVSLVAGSEYSLSFALGHAFPGVRGELSVRLGEDELLQAIAPDVDDTYSIFTHDFVASSTGSIALSFVELSTAFGGNDYGLDDISLTTASVSEIPLPATLPLLATGFVLVGALKARRRKKRQIAKGT